MGYRKDLSVPRWIHWFWITGVILTLQCGSLKSEESVSESSAEVKETGNVSVSHTISVVSVLYSSEESSKEAPIASSPSTVATTKAATTTSIPPQTSESSTAVIEPKEKIRSSKEGRSLMHHAPVIVRVFDKLPEVLNKSAFIDEEERNDSLKVGSETTFVIREEDSKNKIIKEEPSKESTEAMSTSLLIGIIIGALLLMIIGTVGFGVFIYHEKFANKPQTLDDHYANSDSGGHYNYTTTEDFFRRISHIECGGFDLSRDTYSEEMYNLDNDSFLNSLEAMTFPSFSPDTSNRNTFSSDSGV